MLKLNVDDLVEQGLVRKKTYTEGKYKGLSVLKYTKKVFFKNLWHLDDRLLECRGTVIDEENNVIVAPFKKVFNLGENNTTVNPEREVICPVKVNGFMLAVTKTEKYGLIVSTTGTLDSEFAELGRKWVDTLGDGFMKGVTFLFEVCDKSDPHIIEEEEGIYLIGMRYHETGNLEDECFVAGYADSIGANRVERVKCKFKDLNLKVEHEGYMIRDYFTGETLAKYKSPFYLVKKAFLRMGRKRIDLAWDNPLEFRKQIDEEFYDLHEYLVDGYTKEMYHSFTQEERRKLIERYFNEN